jgi:hypothetical protein
MKESPLEQAHAGAFIDEHVVYKVVDSALRSCIAVRRYSVQYYCGKFIRAPEGTKFFVFGSLMCAEDFKQRDPDFWIWSATARGLSSPAGRITDPRHSVDIEDFWRVHNSGRSYGVLGGRRTPSGTLWADEIRLDTRI